MSRIDVLPWVLCVGLALAVLAAYANHFQNEFHFDDSHAITSNPYIEDLRHVPRFFVDATTFSILPGMQTYRPITTTSLAFDFWLGHGRKPFYFHLSTFVWFIVQLILMVFLFRRVMDAADPHPSNMWTAIVAVACYGLHPANAETVNYIIQRGDLYCTLGVVASLVWFAAYPAQRKRGWYLLPAVAAFLAKAPALIYPFILFAYVFLFEQDADPKKWRAAVRATLPAFLVTAAAAVLTAVMTPSNYSPGASSAGSYRLTQPWVALHYFKSFFLPTELSADSDWGYVSGPFSGEALAGFVFVALLLAAGIATARRRGAALPISFGIWWFFLALLPTSLMPLADVTNDHRMFFPFVGLALSVFWGLRLLLFRTRSTGIPACEMPVLLKTTQARMPVLLVLAAVLAAEAVATHERNDVWHSEESLWRDVTLKSPGNLRGLLSYGRVLLMRGDYAGAIPILERAEALAPKSWEVQERLAAAYGGVNRDQEAVKHFARAVVFAPGTADPFYYYGQWLQSRGRLAEAQELLEKALQIDRAHIPARYGLMDVYSAQNNRQALDVLIRETLQLSQNDENVRRYMETRWWYLLTDAHAGKKAEAGSGAEATPEAMLHLSSEYGKTGKYEESIATARKALALQPDYAEAYNNIAAAYLALHRWNEAAQAATEALRLKPDFEVAQKILQRARASGGSAR